MSHDYTYTVVEICYYNKIFNPNHLDVWSTAALAGHHIAAVVVRAAGVAVTRAAPQRVRGQAKVLRLALVAVTPHHVPLAVAATWKSKQRG